jgi:hypothetical protein
MNCLEALHFVLFIIVHYAKELLSPGD